MSLSVDGMLLAVAWADGRVSVYHADDVECNDSKVPFKGRYVSRDAQKRCFDFATMGSMEPVSPSQNGALRSL